MGLKEKAVEAYETDKELTKKSIEKEAEIFAEKALKSLKDILGEECGNIEIVDKQPGATSFRVDGILFEVCASQGYPFVNVIVNCLICGNKINVRVFNIKDIGKALVEPHSKYDCDRALEIKKESDDEKNVLVLSTEARLLEALKDFIRENDCTCSES